MQRLLALLEKEKHDLKTRGGQMLRLNVRDDKLPNGLMLCQIPCEFIELTKREFDAFCRKKPQTSELPKDSIDRRGPIRAALINVQPC